MIACMIVIFVAALCAANRLSGHPSRSQGRRKVRTSSVVESVSEPEVEDDALDLLESLDEVRPMLS